MAKDRETKPGGGMRQGSGEPDDREQENERGQFAGDNRGIQHDKSQGRQADQGQRGGQRGTEHTPGGST